MRARLSRLVRTWVSLNRIYDADETRSWWARLGVSPALAAVIIIAVVGSLVLLVGGPRVDGPGADEFVREHEPGLGRAERLVRGLF